MTHSLKSHPAIEKYLAEPLHVGEPDTVGPLAVFPVFGPAPGERYVSFAQGAKGGVTVRELEHEASVNDIAVENPLEEAVLLYEGEEVLGARWRALIERLVAA